MQFSERCGKFSVHGLHRQLITANFADLNRRNAHQFGALHDFHGIKRFTGDNDAALRFAEEQSIQSVERGH